VGTSKTLYNFYAIAIPIEIWQAVILLRDPPVASMAPTWKTRGTIGRIVSDRLQAFREIVGDVCHHRRFTRKRRMRCQSMERHSSTPQGTHPPSITMDIAMGLLILPS
jgi:hypothetical protein